MKKHKKVSIKDVSNRLAMDENAWLKQLSCMGDFARCYRQLQAQVKKDRRVIARLHKKINALEQKLGTHEGNASIHVDNQGK